MKKNRFFITGILSALIISCVPNDPDNPTLEGSGNNLINGWALTYYEDTTMPFTFINNEGDKAAAIDNDQNGVLDGVYLESGEESVLLDYDEVTRLPKQLITSDGDIIIYNYKENLTKLDLALIRGPEEVKYVRDIEIDSQDHLFDLNSTGLIGKGTKKNVDDMDKVIEGFSMAGKVVSFAISKTGCILSVTAAIATGGIAVPAAVISCTSFALSFADLTATLISQNGTEVDSAIFLGLGLQSLNFDLAGCAIGDIGACSTAAFTILDNSIKLFRDTEGSNQSIINSAIGALSTGFGQVKVTLTWASIADLDLWVTEPNGTKIYFENTNSSTGGYLDVDDTDGFGPENIFWRDNAPTGTYLVQVHNYASNGALSSFYTVQTEINGLVNVFTGSISAENQANSITQFTIGAGKEVSSTSLSDNQILKTRTLKK